MPGNLPKLAKRALSKTEPISKPAKRVNASTVPISETAKSVQTRTVPNTKTCKSDQTRTAPIPKLAKQPRPVQPQPITNQTRIIPVPYPTKPTRTSLTHLSYLHTLATYTAQHKTKMINKKEAKTMKYRIQTTKAQQFINITPMVAEAVRNSQVKNGIAIIYVPHTTAGVTINEAADPDVVHEIITALDKTYPVHGNYQHTEGNSHAHIKASLMGSSCMVIIQEGKILLGTWQGIYFCEFDGPRNREFYVKIIKDA